MSIKVHTTAHRSASYLTPPQYSAFSGESLSHKVGEGLLLNWRAGGDRHQCCASGLGPGWDEMEVHRGKVEERGKP